jgi:hypothetical protein
MSLSEARAEVFELARRNSPTGDGVEEVESEDENRD